MRVDEYNQSESSNQSNICSIRPVKAIETIKNIAIYAKSLDHLVDQTSAHDVKNKKDESSLSDGLESKHDY